MLIFNLGGDGFLNFVQMQRIIAKRNTIFRNLGSICHRGGGMQIFEMTGQKVFMGSTSKLFASNEDIA